MNPLFKIEDSPIRKEFYDQLKADKIEFNWNKKPILMSLFLSFLTVEVKRSKDHLGSGMGWTELRNEEIGLVISGGSFQNGELLNYLELRNLNKGTNRTFVNPFYLFDIMNEAGKKFFVEYYKEDIENLIQERKDKIERLNIALLQETELLKNMGLEFEKLSNIE